MKEVNALISILGEMVHCKQSPYQIVNLPKSQPIQTTHRDKREREKRNRQVRETRETDKRDRQERQTRETDKRDRQERETRATDNRD